MSSINVTLIQADLAWEDKAANLHLLESKMNSIKDKTEIIVLPEMFNTAFSMRPEVLAETMNGKTIAWMKEQSATRRVILTGSLIIQEEGKYFNRAIWMLPNGQYGTYDKRHLFAYGKEDVHFSRGTKRLIASAKGWRIQPQICYDLRFPVWTRQHPADGATEYDLLIYMANWPSPRANAWRTLLQSRAIENQCYVVGVNRVGNDGNNMNHIGDSMVIGPLGEILYHAPAEEAVHTISLDKEHLEHVREKFPFWKDGDDFHLLEDSQ